MWLSAAVADKAGEIKVMPFTLSKIGILCQIQMQISYML